MNRLVLMVLRNFTKAIPAYSKLCYYAKHTDEYSEEEKFDHIRWILQRGLKTGNVDLQVHGLENIPEEGGFLMYSNHQGLFDVVAIAGTSPVPLAVVFKKELAEIPFLKQVVACTKSFKMDREDARQSLQVIQAVTKEVSAGRRYVIFPEGTRSRNGNVMNEFHHGSFRCALKAKCPVIPIALIDCYRPFDEKGSAWISPQLHYLSPIMPEEYEGMNTTALAELVKARIQDTIDKYSQEEQK